MTFRILPGAGYKVNTNQSSATTAIIDDEATDTITFNSFPIAETGLATGQEINLASAGRTGEDVNVSYSIDTTH